MKNLREHLIDPRSPDRKPRRAAYALPTLFTAGNVFLGFYSLMESFRGAMLTATAIDAARIHFSYAAIAIGIAVLLDGLDGLIARMTNTVSDFGREMDSLADVITFGIAPAVLAFAWGIEFTDAPPGPFTPDDLHRAGYFFAFLYLLCGAMRLARFNVQTNPVPKNPGRPDRKYFVGMPIPSAAGTIAAIVFAAGSVPLRSWIWSAGWLAVLSLLAFLMVSTWRYPSPKGWNLLRPQSPVVFIFAGCLIYLISTVPQPVLLAMAITYVSSGILIRIGGIVRRYWKSRPHSHGRPEQQIG
jgi:CDP-diacylglycerol---serine O-phosphatidyltransferase